MRKKCVLVSGPTITKDTYLIDGLKKAASVIKCPDLKSIEKLLAQNHVDLILMEILKDKYSEVSIIKRLLSRNKDLKIVLINGNSDQEIIAKAFRYGVRDAFRMPYKVDLIVERIEALIKY